MDFTTINSKSILLSQGFAKAEKRRILWNASAKNAIIATLDKIRRENSTLLYIQSIDSIRNQEFINLRLFERHSGIIKSETKEDGSQSHRSYMIKGGYIVYTQAVNGKIYVLVSYPRVEEIIMKVPEKLISCYEPTDIDEQLVLSHVGQFLNEMLNWENHNAGNSYLGFEYKWSTASTNQT